MDVAITGASGFIGTALTEKLTALGHRVIPLVRRPIEAGETAIAWDPGAATIDQAALEGVDAVIHLAAENIGRRRWSQAQKDRLLHSRTRGTTLIAEAIAGLSRPPRVFISASAIGYYGDRGDEVLTEASAPGDDFLADVCQRWEAASRLAALAGIRTVNIRTGLVLHEKEGALGRQLFLFKAGLGGRIGTGEQWQSWISLPDHLGAICHLLEADVEGPVNLTAPKPVTNREFTKTLGHVLRRPTVLPIPIFAPAILYGRELVKSLLLSSQRVRPQVLENSGYRFLHTDFEGAVRVTLDLPHPGDQ